MSKSSKFIEYMKLHLISLQQDKEDIVSTVGDESVDWHFIEGQIEATNHLLSVALGIMEESERMYS